MKKRITDKEKQEHNEFLEKVCKISNCNCDVKNPCAKCRKLVLGKEFLKLIENIDIEDK